MKQSRLLGTLAACLLFLSSFLPPTAAFATTVSGQGTWETTLQPRDLDGNPATIEAYYDTDLNITWLADAYYAGNIMDWNTANNWAMSLDINGIIGWRLPHVNPINDVSYINSFSYNGSTDIGYNVSAPGTIYSGGIGSEMAHMFYNTLGNLSGCDPILSTSISCSVQSGAGLTNTGPFINIKSYSYWASTEYNINNGWMFSSINLAQQGFTKTNGGDAWAVHDRAVGAAIVPAPAAVWLFGTGLLGLTSVARRKKSS
jgi:hypothetical protein